MNEKKYVVTVTETIARHIPVSAGSEAEAKKKVQETFVCSDVDEGGPLSENDSYKLEFTCEC